MVFSEKEAFPPKYGVLAQVLPPSAALLKQHSPLTGMLMSSLPEQFYEAMAEMGSTPFIPFAQTGALEKKYLEFQRNIQHVLCPQVRSL